MEKLVNFENETKLFVIQQKKRTTKNGENKRKTHTTMKQVKFNDKLSLFSQKKKKNQQNRRLQRIEMVRVLKILN